MNYGKRLEQVGAGMLMVLMLWVLMAGSCVVYGMGVENPPAKYLVGMGKTGLLSLDMTAAEAVEVFTLQYGGRTLKSKEPAGEGMMADVIIGYFAGESEPALKILLASDGKIYRISALSPKLKTQRGIHTGSSWSEIRTAYPEVKITFEGTVGVLLPKEQVTLQLDLRPDVEWSLVQAGLAEVPGDVKVLSFFTY